MTSISLCAVFGLVIAPSLAPSAAAALINGDFEQGETGWSTIFSGGRYWKADADGPSEFSGDPSENPFFGNNGPSPHSPLVSLTGSSAPFGGNQMLQLDSFQSDSPTSEFRDSFGQNWSFFPTYYNISIQQLVTLSSKDLISGLARFCTSDFASFADFASVTIDGQTIWSCGIDRVFDLAAYEQLGTSSSEWEAWSWSAPSAKDYLVSLNLYGDDEFNSQAYFDNIQVTRASIPDSGSAVLLLGLSLLAIAATHRAHKRCERLRRCSGIQRHWSDVQKVILTRIPAGGGGRIVPLGRDGRTNWK